ncbi:MAG: PQQ-binding-like beta-propeller repeat protein [Pseudomonadota bacterium]
MTRRGSVRGRRILPYAFTTLFTGLLVALAGCDRPGEPADPYAAWRSYAGTTDSAQFSSLTHIDKGNVGELIEVWRYPTGDANHRGTPLVIDGVMYVIAYNGVAALDAATGRELWRAPDTAAPYVRGMAFWADAEGGNRRLLVTHEHHLRALSVLDGSAITSFGDNGRIDLRANLSRETGPIRRIATGTPGRIFEDLIIMGSSITDETYGGPPGDVRAYNVLTGELVWTFHTIPHPGEFGYETWPEDAWQHIGAANVWTNMSIDEARGIIYMPTGAPSYHFYGGNRAGDNLFANTLLALDARTGKRIWHFQLIHHDIWDYDIAMAPKLTRVRRDGRVIDAVVVAGKHGYLYVFDRETGEPVYPIEERPVPRSDVPGEKASRTQPFPVGLEPFARLSLSADELSPYADPAELEALAVRIRAARNEGLFTPPSFQGSVSVPGSRGGAQYGNGAVLPGAGMFYLAVIESPTIPKLQVRPQMLAEDWQSAGVASVYQTNCAICHGIQGQGQQPLFPALADVSERLSESEFVEVVSQGRGRMAAYPHLAARLPALYGYLDEIGRALPQTMPPAISETPQHYHSGYHHFFTSTGLLGPPPWSKLVAYDLNIGEIVWEKPYGDVRELAARGITGTGSLFPTCSLMATAAGLLFSTTNDGKIRAWDQTDGAVLWSADLPADAGGIPATYAIAGRQFVVATATKSARRADGSPSGQHAYVAFALPE